MPILKPIAGHTNCQLIERYLEKNGRALARDFFRLSWDENTMMDLSGHLKDEVRWADEMDWTRKKKKTDGPFGNMRARTYVHYVLSPQPDDDITLDQLRELSKAWVNRFFPEFQVAIVYHDDNAGHIPHAHIVVNNPNLDRGGRLQVPDPLLLNRTLQDMACERGLTGLSNEMPEEEDGGIAKLAAKGLPEKAHPRSLQNVYLGRAEKELAESGAYSWVADIRNRVSVAKALARNESEFRQVLEMLDVNVADNSAKAKREDWIYSLADEPSKRVSGERLGLLYAKETLQRDFKRAGSYHPGAKSSREILKNAEGAVLINDLYSLDELSHALSVCANHNASSLSDCDRAISRLNARAAKVEPKEGRRLLDEADELMAARKYMSERNLLPEKNQTTTKERVERRKSAAQKSKQSNEQQQRRTEQQREQTRERQQR